MTTPTGQVKVADAQHWSRSMHPGQEIQVDGPTQKGSERDSAPLQLHKLWEQFLPKQVMEAFIICMNARVEKTFPKARTALSPWWHTTLLNALINTACYFPHSTCYLHSQHVLYILRIITVWCPDTGHPLSLFAEFYYFTILLAQILLYSLPPAKVPTCHIPCNPTT